MNDQIIASVIVGAVFAFMVALATYLANPAAVITVCIIGTGTALMMAAQD